MSIFVSEIGTVHVCEFFEQVLEIIADHFFLENGEIFYKKSSFQKSYICQKCHLFYKFFEWKMFPVDYTIFHKKKYKLCVWEHIEKNPINGVCKLKKNIKKSRF